MTKLGNANTAPATLSVIVPCFDEERTLQSCIDRVLELNDGGDLSLEIIIVDDCSRDRSLEIARGLEAQHPEIRVLQHARNQGKGAALRTGFREAKGDFIAVQDADLEYNPLELRKLVEPLRDGRADVVIGSRFKGAGPHRVLYFWHYMGNAFLTFLSNMFTDLNLTDMESCYKVFRRVAIQDIEIEENRFGFEPEIVAKVAHKKLRIYEMAISYDGRTYAEGKKINWRDGVRALYCIFRYNSYHLPLPIQFLAYLVIGFIAGLVNLALFVIFFEVGLPLLGATLSAFVIAAAVNYVLCIAILFRHKARWNTTGEILAYLLVVAVAAAVDFGITSGLMALGTAPWLAKAWASVIGVVVNYLGRRYFVF